MGRNISSFRSLLPPLESADERYVVIPPGRDLIVESDRFKVVFYLQGGVKLDIPGHPPLTIREGDAVSMSDIRTIRYRPVEQNQEFRNHVLVIRLEFPEALKKSSALPAGSSLASLRRALAGELSGVHYFPAALDRPGCREALRQLRQEAEHGHDVSPWIASSLCLFLVSSLLQRPGSSLPSGGTLERGAATAQHARQFIEEHYHENLSLSHIAWQVRISGEHLERLFKKHFGITVFECLDRRRIDKARELLLSSDFPAVQIAKLCGFSSANLFGRHFKARTGTTPLSYRLQHRKTESFSPSILGPRSEKPSGDKNQF